MFKLILVPLDGSERAERAAFVAARCARSTGSALLFLRVVHAPARLGLTGEPPMLAMTAAEEDVLHVATYLDQFARREEFKDLDIETQALEGDVVETILEVAADEQVDAVMLCTHGRSGIMRRAFGSVAHGLVRSSPVPVFVLRAKDSAFHSDEAHGLRAMVALDGSERAEHALLPAADLVESLSVAKPATLWLVRVVPIPDVPPSGGNDSVSGEWTERQRDLHAHMVEEATTYLRKVSDRLIYNELAGRMIAVEQAVIPYPDIGGALINAATGAISPGRCDVIAMATHGRTGIQGWMVGSIAERVLDAAPIPMLVISTRKQRSQLAEGPAGQEVGPITTITTQHEMDAPGRTGL
ncbi:MAG: universal stress protein [Ktedonobacterales bacterium]